MASITSRVGHANHLIPRFLRLSGINCVRQCRCIVTSSVPQYQQTPSRLQLSHVPADKYQRTTITEDVQRAAARSDWDDPRAADKLNKDQPTDESMLDPTIRHFTVNFVCSML
jgi:hypothetical protein